MQMSGNRPYTATILCLLGLYFLLAAAAVPRLAPYLDEGFFAAPPWALLHQGHFGSLTLEPCAYPLLREYPAAAVPRINKRNYINMPLHGVLQSGWYTVTGFSLESMRWLSVLWGGVYLLATAAIATISTGRRWVGLGAMGIVAADPGFFLWACRGRMDVMAAALGLSGIALYLHWRQERLPLALLAGNCAAAAAGMTHPMGGIVAVFSLTMTALILDARRLPRWRHLLPVLAPYLLAAAGWGWYIAQDPAAFTAQFGATLGKRASGGAAVWELPWRELRDRWLPAYGFGAGIAAWKLLALAGYAVALLWTLVRWRRVDRSVKLLAGLALLAMTALGFLDSYRQQPYTVSVLAPLAALAAWHLANAPRWVWAAAGLVLAIEAGSSVRLLLQDRRATQYEPVIAYLRLHNPERLPVAGSSELGFGLGFDGVLRDDFRLGYCSGRQPEWIIASPAYRDGWRHMERFEPEAGRYVADLLLKRYETVREDPVYTIYRRKTDGSIRPAR